MQNKKIKKTLDILKGKLNNAATSGGVKSIRKWEKLLKKAEFRGAKTICKDLGKLRRQLENDDLDSSKIKELLISMGESTVRVAGHEEQKGIEKIEKLGEALIKAGKNLGAKKRSKGKSKTKNSAKKSKNSAKKSKNSTKKSKS